MSTKKEQSIQDILSSFNEMADLVLAQLSHVEKLMIGEDDRSEQEELISKISDE